MTIEMYVELFLLLTVTILVAYIGASIDIWLIHRRARKQSEQQRLIDTLKR